MRKLFILCSISITAPVACLPTASHNSHHRAQSEIRKTLQRRTVSHLLCPDTTATAIYLFHQGQSDFIYHDGFQLTTEHWVRIKILKPQGVSYADVSGSLLLSYR